MPSESPITNTTSEYPFTAASCIFSESSSDESCFPSTQRAILYARFGSFGISSLSFCVSVMLSLA